MESAGTEREGGVQVGAVGIATRGERGGGLQATDPSTALGRARASVE
jgi:hypothetical protein